jgi:hypothetical protein
MFEKSKSAITFKEFQNTLNVINNFDNEWGHFCDPDNNNNINNIIQNNFYQYKKEIKKTSQTKELIKIEKISKIKEPIEKEKKEPIEKEKEKKEQIKIEKKEPIEKEEKEPKNFSIIKNIFNYTIIISISFYVIYKLSETVGGL